MIELTDLMCQAIATDPTEPIWLVDPRTRQTYVLLRKEEYDLVKGILGQDDDLDGIDVARLIAQTMREEDENDPTLESYQEKQEPKRPSTVTL